MYANMYVIFTLNRLSRDNLEMLTTINCESNLMWGALFACAAYEEGKLVIYEAKRTRKTLHTYA